MILSKKNICIGEALSNLGEKKGWGKWLIVSLFIIHCSLLSAQSAPQDTAIHVYQSNAVKNLVQKRADYAYATRGTFPGFRIQINFGQNRDEANKTVSDFAAKYPGIPTYLSYQQPYFKVNVGDFRTKLEAVKNLNIIRKDYPGAFVVKDKINPPAVKK